MRNVNDHPHRVEESLYGAIGTSDCHKVGIMGGCGLDCWVYQEGRCGVPDEMIERFETDKDEENHKRLYGGSPRRG